MTMHAPPLSDRGYLSDTYGVSVSFVDTLEIIPDLMWPLSVRTFAQMRNDPQLSAVLNAYTLPLRQAPKHVDPAGCRDEVTQQISDDLGLPILGKDADPGPARRRGVDFDEHFRLAMLHLIFGHMPFEERYEIREGKARLIALSERMPQTIREIKLDKPGTLAGIQQNASDALIPADRLMWYAKDREGAAWQGRSMFRPAYGAWLLKHEAQRVLATSGRRFGMGVPSVQAPAGATPGMLDQAKLLATSIRVGDESGIGLPAGFSLSLTGMTGTAPDMLGFIRYLDQQMAQMALAGILNLDASPNGSRALGDTMVNLMLLSLNSIAGEMSTVLTRQSVRMVDYNWGPDEPAPRIVIGDVGSRPEATAEALSGLITCGALIPDESLDAWVRERWTLPGRAIDGPGAVKAGAAPRELAELIQKMYLGVDTIVTADEARGVLNRAGAGLTGSLPEPPAPPPAVPPPGGEVPPAGGTDPGTGTAPPAAGTTVKVPAHTRSTPTTK